MKSLVTGTSANRAASTGWHTKALWLGAAALALLGVLFTLEISWTSILKFAPYLLFLACPIMFLFMCHSHKKGEEKSDGTKE